jgi:hypothetical protein
MACARADVSAPNVTPTFAQIIISHIGMAPLVQHRAASRERIFRFLLCERTSPQQSANFSGQA